MRRARVTPWHFHPAHDEVVVPRRVDPTGRHGPTPDMVRGKGWHRLGGGWYVAADARDDLPAQRIVEAAVHLPERSAVTGWAALHWQGASYFDGLRFGHPPRPVPLAVSLRNVRPRDGLVTTKESLRPADLTVVDGLRVTTAVRSVLYEMRYAASVRAAVRIGDLALISDLVSTEELDAYVRGFLGGRTGVDQARRALQLTSENCWSPTEHDLRMVWLDAGIAPPLCNAPVFDLFGRHVATPDLLDPATGLAGEYEGREFHTGAKRAADLDRDEQMRAVGLEVVTMVAEDRRDPGPVMQRLASARARAGRRTGPRQWTLAQPPWWRATHTVALRRELTADQRARIPGRLAA